MPAGPRFELITLLAYNELLRLKIGSCPINSSTFLTPCEQNIVICSYQEFCALTGVPFNKLTLNGRLEDGFYVSEINKLRTMILYNADKYTKRVRFTLLHEVGHIILNHKRNAPLEEAEANFFASQFLIPGALLLEIYRRGYNLDACKLCRIFDISLACAQVKIEQFTLRRHITTHLDDRLVRRFTPYLDQYFPSKTAPIHNDLHLFGSLENYRAFQRFEDSTLFP